jgi:hypothetical protein
LRQVLSIDGRGYEIVGVMSADVRFPAVVDLWIPARQQAPEYPLDPEADVTTTFGSHYLGVVGRLTTAVLALSPNHLNEVAPTVNFATTAFALALSLAAVFLAAVAALAYGVGVVRRPAIRAGRFIGRSRPAAIRRRLLAGGQCAASVALLVLAVLLLRSFDALRHVDPGFVRRASIPRMLFCPRCGTPRAACRPDSSSR